MFAGYERHRPEKTVLYQTIRKNLIGYRLQAMTQWPGFVKKEFSDYLNCGLLSQGFIRIYCSTCKAEKLLAFSCKRRGFCPSCTARRMNITADHLVAKVIPQVPTRQWVLSFPVELRFAMAYRPEIQKQMLKIFMATISHWYKSKAKPQGQRKSLSVGAVTVIQRFGGALNLNIHFHTIFLDGAYDDNGFIKTPAPRKEDIHELTRKIHAKAKKYLEQREDEAVGEVGLRQLFFSKSTQLIGEPVQWQTDTNSYKGFSLNAEVAVRKNNRQKLEKLCRYILRGPISTERLHKLPNGDLLYRLKKTWPNGATHIRLTPYEFLDRLHGLVPPPRKNLIRYHGILAPNSKARKKVIPKQQPAKSKNMTWAAMLKKIFNIDATHCAVCGNPVKVLAVINDLKVARKILEHIGEEVVDPAPELPVTRGPLKAAFPEIESQLPSDW